MTTAFTDVQELVNRVFTEAFGRTPLRRRLEDIKQEHDELQAWRDMRNMKEEAGQLLASLIQLCNENEWPLEEVLQAAIDTIRHRMAQYRSLGRKTKVAILGGAFDPITLGHIQTAQYVLDVARTFDEVWIMPCFRHMDNKQMASPDMRLRMCQIAVRKDGRIRVSDYEIANQFAGETYHLVNRLLEEEWAKNQFNFSFIIGLDNALDFHTWVNAEDLMKLIRFVVVPRVGYKPDPKVTWYQQPPHIDLTGCERKIADTASREVRRIFREKRDEEKLSELLDSEVLKFIRQTKIYKQCRL